MLIKRVYQYLNRYGFINFGVYTSPNTPTPASNAPRILVVGAGISGKIYNISRPIFAICGAGISSQRCGLYLLYIFLTLVFPIYITTMKIESRSNSKT